jgi:hypothetical protein
MNGIDNSFIGPILVAIIAGFFSLIGLITSKEQKVSEFRQDWINALRDSISKYIAAISSLSRLHADQLRQGPAQQLSPILTKEVEEESIKVHLAYNDIIFRINKEEKRKNSKKVNDDFCIVLEEMQDKFIRHELGDIQQYCNVLQDNAKLLLKLEWKRVKKGEPIFRLAKYSAAGIILIALLALSFIFGRMYHWV